jgi:hypothetical protein
LMMFGVETETTSVFWLILMSDLVFLLLPIIISMICEEVAFVGETAMWSSDSGYTSMVIPWWPMRKN